MRSRDSVFLPSSVTPTRQPPATLRPSMVSNSLGRGWTDALRTLPKRTPENFNWLLLVLDVSGKTINVTGFKSRKKASDELAKIETISDSQTDAVLVWVNSIDELRSAYPNYYADTAAFLKALEFSLAKGNLHRIASEPKK
jgi:hypothetical protein